MVRIAPVIRAAVIVCLVNLLSPLPSIAERYCFHDPNGTAVPFAPYTTKSLWFRDSGTGCDDASADAQINAPTADVDISISVDMDSLDINVASFKTSAAIESNNDTSITAGTITFEEPFGYNFDQLILYGNVISGGGGVTNLSNATIHGNVIESSVFLTSSTVHGNVTLLSGSLVNSIIIGNLTVVILQDDSFASPIVNSPVFGTTTFIFRDALSPWSTTLNLNSKTVVADGVALNVSGATYNDDTVFQAINGGSILGLPTPTPTPSPTSTSTPTATMTPTATATFTPMATATPTVPPPPTFSLGEISGSVRLTSGTPLPGVVINGGILGTTLTNDAGRFVLTDATENAEYILRAELTGHIFSPESVQVVSRIGEFEPSFVAEPLNTDADECDLKRTAQRFVMIDALGRSLVLSATRLIDELRDSRSSKNAAYVALSQRLSESFISLMTLTPSLPEISYAKCPRDSQCSKRKLTSHYRSQKKNFQQLKKAALQIKSMTKNATASEGAKLKRLEALANKNFNRFEKLQAMLPKSTYDCAELN